MKILYHHRTASKDGQAVHIEEMIEALRAQGHEVRVVAPQVAAGGAMGAKVGWAHWLKARLPKALYELLELAYSAVAYRRLVAAARGFGPDIIYERYNLFLLAGVLARRRLKVPLLLEVNAPLADERGSADGLGLPALARWAERTAWRQADIVLPVTRVLAEIIASQAALAADRIEVIPNGINPTHFAGAPPPQAAKEALGWRDQLVLGFTGFVREWHGVDRVIRWLAGPEAPPNARLYVVGDGPARAPLEKLAGELGVRERVSFTGFVARAEVPARVAAFDIALQPAVTPYASPLKLFEYLALGKAIVAPRSANIMEVLRDGDNALLFDEHDEGRFAEALTRLARDPALRGRLAERARMTITEQGLTWQRNAQRVAKLAHRLGAERELARRAGSALRAGRTKPR
ncbi:MAG: glycosyltransferase family 4 protein [Rubrivivax sp.]|nr:glycosyltransferase family 4 protein [Rubrivivax sp.]